MATTSKHPGLILKEARARKGHTQAVAGGVLGVTEKMVYYIERGERQPGKRVIEKLRDAYGIPIEVWFR